MAGIGSLTTSSSNKHYKVRDGKGSIFDRNIQSYLKNRRNFIRQLLIISLLRNKIDYQACYLKYLYGRRATGR